MYEPAADDEGIDPNWEKVLGDEKNIDHDGRGVECLVDLEMR